MVLGGFWVGSGRSWDMVLGFWKDLGGFCVGSGMVLGGFWLGFWEGLGMVLGGFWKGFGRVM